MKSLMLIFALSLCAAAQTLVGLPNVEISGDAINPVVTNHHQTQNIVGLVLIEEATNGQITHTLERFVPPKTDGIAPGESLYIFEGMLHTTEATAKGVLIREKVTVDAAVFADGSAVGPDTTGRLQTLAGRLKAMHDVGQQVHDGDWFGVEKIVARDHKMGDALDFAQKHAARSLVELRDAKGLAAASDLAERYLALPVNVVLKGDN